MTKEEKEIRVLEARIKKIRDPLFKEEAKLVESEMICEFTNQDKWPKNPVIAVLYHKRYNSYYFRNTDGSIGSGWNHCRPLKGWVKEGKV